MQNPCLLRRDLGPVAVFTFHRPQVRNALNTELLNALSDALDAAEQDPQVRVAVFTGEDRSFISGADVNELGQAGGLAALEYSRRGAQVFRKVERFPKPTIAAINGYAFGGGLEFALCCDLRIACESARFAAPEVTLGIIPGMGGIQRLPRLIGAGRAKDLLFTGRRVSAQEALEIGLVQAVAAPDAFWDTVMEKAHCIAQNSPTALRLLKGALLAGLDAPFDSTTAIDAGYAAACFSTEDQKEGFAAFLEKRPPHFSGQ